VRYEWDEVKDDLNQRKHGVSFELATLVFNDVNVVLRLDRVDEYGEQRWHAIGVIQVESEEELLLLVVHVYRENQDDEQIIRIISARAAGNDDVRRYQEQAMD
jgi:uncharacterized DUF497 family protein